MIGGVLAYLGPGGAVTALGSALALLVAVAAALLGTVWYPAKQLLGWWRRRRTPRRGTPR